MGDDRQSIADNIPPPLERPWWMKVHGEGPPVSNLEEVMDQFLCDSHAQALEQACEKAAKRFDVRCLDKIIPGMEQDQLENMQKWYGHVSKFMKYRNQVSEKHERQMELRMHRKHNKQDAWEGFESDEDSGSEAQSVMAMPSVRSEVPRAFNNKGRESPAGSSGRQSTMRGRGSQPSRLTMAGSMLVGRPSPGGGVSTSQRTSPTPNPESASAFCRSEKEEEDMSPKASSRRGSGNRRRTSSRPSASKFSTSPP